MTQRYAHLAPQTLLDAAEVVADVIGEPQPPRRERTCGCTCLTTSYPSAASVIQARSRPAPV